MALLRSSIGSDTSPIVRGRRVVLRAPQMSDYAEWAELRAQSREHLVSWEPAWTRDELTRGAYRRRVRHYSKEAREDLGYAFFILAHDETTGMRAVGGRWGGVGESERAKLAGGITLSNVRRGVTQAATLGYWIGLPHVGRGLMSDALACLVPFAFDVLRLHRIEAAVMPANTPSLKLLDKAGFRREGVARRYLKIRGLWEDHVICSLIADDIAEAHGVPR